MINIDSFWTKVAITANPDSCWDWGGAIETERGKGLFSIRQGVRWDAHRMAYLVSTGELMDGFQVKQSCKNKRCVNHAHLYLRAKTDITRKHTQFIKIFCKKCGVSIGRTGRDGVCRSHAFKNPTSKETRGKMSKARCGSNHHNWIHDRSLVKIQEERNNPNDKQWKKAVFMRYNYKCRVTSQECSGRIEAHHIVRWIEAPLLRYDINNGITLCAKHHPRRKADELRLTPLFYELIGKNLDNQIKN